MQRVAGECELTIIAYCLTRTYFETPAHYQAFVGEYLSQRASLPQDLLRLDERLED